jgi:hypothetical protein
MGRGAPADVAPAPNTAELLRRTFQSDVLTRPRCGGSPRAGAGGPGLTEGDEADPYRSSV